MNRFLFDTNVILYLFDSNEKIRQALAVTLVKPFIDSETGYLSSQCLSEFVNAATRGSHPILSKDSIFLDLQLLIESFQIIPLTDTIVVEAARGFYEYKLSYYDAQIWATAKLYQIPVIFTEDFQDGQILEGVRFINPFSEKFDLKNWI